MNNDLSLSDNPKSFKVQNDQLTPSSNTGVNNSISGVHVDFLRATGKVDCLGAGVTEEDKVMSFVYKLQRLLGLSTDGQTVNGSDFYDFKQRLVYTDDREFSSLGFICWGGSNQRGSFLLNLTGECCEYLTLNSLMVPLHGLLSRYDMSLKRCDLAYDDFAGKRDVRHAAVMWKSGAFKLRTQPSASCAGNWLCDDDTKGRTLYVGSRSSGKMLRVYDKGKQLGDAGSDWVRWEVEFKSMNRILPLSMLLDPEGYFKGAYPCFSDNSVFDISGDPTIIKTIRKKAKTAMTSVVESAKLTYGQLLQTMREMKSLYPDDTAILDALCREGIPKCLRAVVMQTVAPEIQKRTIFPVQYEYSG